MTRLCILATLILLLHSCHALAQHLHPESWYRDQWCAQVGGQVEAVLDDGTRVDCLTAFTAWELDFAPKWAEAVGQSLHYARLTGKTPGIVLIMERPADARHLARLRGVVDAYALPVQVLTVPGLLRGPK